MKFKDITGQKFGKLTALRRLHNTKGNTKWLCVCDCGNFKEVYLSDLRSCKCLQKELFSNRLKKHNKSKTPLYRVYQSMKQRCYNKNDKAYKNYGGRGIKVCEEWLNDVQAFYDWSVNHGYKKGLQLDRIDVDVGYSQNNCRWVTPKVNSNNKRNTRYFTINNITKSLSEWCDIYKVKYKNVLMRLYRGWSIEKALNIGKGA